MNNKNWIYRPKSEKQIKNMFLTKKPMGFKSLIDFQNWYNKNPKVCKYCGLTEEESQEIIHRGLLKSKRFPLSGLIRQGVFRGYWLEIDRKNPDGPYSTENCVFSCTFCNNDKSDIFSYNQYLEFREDRISFLRKLLNK